MTAKYTQAPATVCLGSYPQANVYYILPPYTGDMYMVPTGERAKNGKWKVLIVNLADGCKVKKGYLADIDFPQWKLAKTVPGRVLALVKRALCPSPHIGFHPWQIRSV